MKTTKAQYLLLILEELTKNQKIAVGTWTTAGLGGAGYLAHTHGSQIADTTANIASHVARSAEKYGVTSKIPGIIKSIAPEASLDAYRHIAGQVIRSKIHSATGY